MDEEDMLPLKRVELSLTKFNEVAIPHHLDLLRQHKANILKYEQRGEAARARAEQARARGAARRLRALLLEMDALRARVRVPDRAHFDERARRARDDTLRAIVDYLGTDPVPISRSVQEEVAASTESVGLVRDEPVPWDDAGPVQLQVDDRELTLREREESLRAWGELQHDVAALHDVWRRAHGAATAHAHSVAAVQRDVGVAAEHVGAARQQLAGAERAYGAALAAGGACAGALVGGPVGLAAGAKAGALAAAAGALLGYWGGRLLQRVRGAPPPPPPDKDL